MLDLNALAEPSSNPSGLQLEVAYMIGDTGEILAIGTLPDGDIHIAELVPDGPCDSDCETTIAASYDQRRLGLPQRPVPSN